MTDENRPAHSPLGASSAERWMNCPGSVALIKRLEIPEDTDEPDYRANGTAAHEAIAKCLHEGLDAWEVIGFKTTNGVEVDVEIADAIQVYLDTVRPSFVNALAVLIEEGISSDIHPDFYGTVDCAVIRQVDELICLDVNDYKHGEGITVEVKNNPQLMYYAFGILDKHPEINGAVRLRIIQPRGFHHDGTIRQWVTDADTIRAWAAEILAPAIELTAFDQSLDAGSWCRFCPAKLVCPLVEGLFRAAATYNPKRVVSAENKSLAQSYQSISAVKFYLKALEDETYRRLNLGQMDDCLDLVKLVYKKANRVWNPGAAAVLAGKLGAAVMTTPEMKSPAEVEKLGADAKTLVHEWAHTPEAGLTVALASDSRVGVKVKTSSERFAGAIAAIKEDGA